MIYRKALCLANGERKIFSSGEMANLMSTDAEKLWLLPNLSNVWHAPIRIILALSLLYRVRNCDLTFKIGNFMIKDTKLGIRAGDGSYREYL